MAQNRLWKHHFVQQFGYRVLIPLKSRNGAQLVCTLILQLSQSFAVVVPSRIGLIRLLSLRCGLASN